MAKRTLLVTLEMEVDENLCKLELNREKSMFENNTEYEAFFTNNDLAYENIMDEIIDNMNYRITKVEDELCGNVMWCE